MSEETPKAKPKKELVITGETLEYSRIPQTDAEGQVARRRFHTQVNAGEGQQMAGSFGTLPGVVEYSTTVGEMAKGARTACASCKHWDQKAWHRFLSLSSGPASKAEDRQTVATLTSRLVQAGLVLLKADGTTDEAATMANLGICRPLSDIIEGMVGRDPMHWPAVSWREATCPTYVQAGPHRVEITTPEAPYGLYKAVDNTSEKIGAQRYDKILTDASGK